MSKKLIILILLLTLIAAGCTGKDTTTIKTSEDGVNTEISVPKGAENDWCQVGSTMQSSNPGTGAAYSMEVKGIQTVDGVRMCKAVFESNVDPEFARADYFWSENGESFMFTYYDSAGKVVYKYVMKDGKITIVDKDGKTTEFGG